MARPESVALGGYFPTPVSVLDLVTKTLRFGLGMRQLPSLVDPVAGTGEALHALAESWQARFPARFRGIEPHTVAIELEADRAAACAGRGFDQVLHADSLQVAWSRSAHALFLNPPYDHDSDHGRLEHRFLCRWFSALHALGLLVYIVPPAGLAASAETLAENFFDIVVYRFPDGEFDAYRQLVVLATRRTVAESDPRAVEALRVASRDPRSLPVIGDAPDSYAPALGWSPGPLEVAALPFDPALYEGLIEDTEAFDDGCSVELDAMWTPSYSVASHPKPAQIAIAAAAGLFDGLRLTSSEPGDPPVLVSAQLGRGANVLGSETIERPSGGDETLVQYRERPALRVALLDLSTFTIHRLKPGSLPSGAAAIDDWNIADFMERYQGSMLDGLDQALTRIHDPANPEHAIALPALARTCFPYQAHAVIAALKVAALGVDDPPFFAEVGTGKTQMSLAFARALFPDARAATVEQLRDQGFREASRTLPRVRTVLVVCPPHLVDTWREEAAEILGPSFPVHVLRSIYDVDARKAPTGPQLLLMTESTAKLGHRFRGLRDTRAPIRRRCPSCGSIVEDAADSLAKRRSRCASVTTLPKNAKARLAVTLASLFRGHLSRGEVARLAPAIPLGSATPKRPSQSIGRSIRVARALVEAFAASRDCSILDRLRSVLESGPDEGPADAYTPGYLGFQLMPELELLVKTGAWDESVRCGEPLYSATAAPLSTDPRPSEDATGPRRYPLASYIARQCPRLVDLLIVDEAHGAADRASARNAAVKRLANRRTKLFLTGSSLNGYAASLHQLMAMASRSFAQRFRDDQTSFLQAYGYAEFWSKHKSGPLPARGAFSDRIVGGRRRVKQTPGVHPALMLDWMMRFCVFVHKADTEQPLPPCTESVRALDFDDEIAGDAQLRLEYATLHEKLMHQIRRDYRADGKSLLTGALAQLVNVPDLLTEDLGGPYTVRNPWGGDDFHRCAALPASYRTPRERFLVERVLANVADNQPTLVFIQSTGRRNLGPRLVRILAEDAGVEAAFLDARRVTAAKRHRWINDRVNRPGLPVLIVNPAAVSTGLNCLIRFTRAIWHQGTYNVRDYRQANGRIHRIRQTRPVEIVMSYLRGTVQERQIHLLASKLTAALRVDGLDLHSALVAAGADLGANEQDMALGAAIYEQLLQGSSATERFEYFSELPTSTASPFERPLPGLETETLESPDQLVLPMVPKSTQAPALRAARASRPGAKLSRRPRLRQPKDIITGVFQTTVKGNG